MSSKTKIVVLRMKEIIYTAIFVGLGILLITLLFIMFRPKKDVAVSLDATKYIPGVYSSSLKLGTQEVNVEVTVDSSKITSITMVPLSDSVATMYPLVQPSLQLLSNQILERQTTEGVTYTEDTKYTSQVLVGAIDKAIKKAEVEK